MKDQHTYLIAASIFLAKALPAETCFFFGAVLFYFAWTEK